MPLNKKGMFFNSTQRAMASEGKGRRAPSAPSAPKAMEAEVGSPFSSHTTLHDHGDGTFHTEHEDGSEEQHPHIGHALMALAAKHGGDGKHLHVVNDGFSSTSHQAESGGAVEGPHDHENIEELKAHLDQFFTEEENEPSEENEMASGHDKEVY